MPSARRAREEDQADRAVSLGPFVAGIPSLDRFDALLVVVLALLFVWTATFVAVPALHVGTVAPALDLVLDTVGLVTALGVALLSWARFIETGEAHALSRAAAFLTLAVPNAVHILALITDPFFAVGVSLESHGQAPVYAFALARPVAALLLVAGTLIERDHPRRMTALLAALLPAGLIAAITLLVQEFPSAVPTLANVASAGVSGSAPATQTVLGTLLAALAVVLLFIAALASRREFRRSGAVDEAYLAIGLVIGAFGQLDTALRPTYAGLVTAGDLLRLAFYVVLLLGLLARTYQTLHALTVSNVMLARLKDVEADRAALAERARLSRELHDGLAQDLWFAKVQASRLASKADLSEENRLLIGGLASGIDASLGEARQAVMALRVAPGAGPPLRVALTETVDDFEDRYGIRAEFDCPNDLPRLPVRAESELLRICQEALANVARHADATSVRVQVRDLGQRVTLVIRDNGQGFDAARVGEGHFGIATMRERAALIGARFELATRARDGTTVAVSVPLASPPLPAEA